MDSKFNSVYGNNNRCYNKICYNYDCTDFSLYLKNNVIYMECERRFL